MPLRKPFASRSVSWGIFEALGEEPSAAALHDGVDEQPVLVDQTAFNEGVAQRDASGDHDVLARLVLESLHLLDRIAGHDCGVLPFRVGHGRRDDVLLHVVEVIGVSRGIVGLLRPVATEVLERLSAQ